MKRDWFVKDIFDFNTEKAFKEWGIEIKKKR